jgi:dihydrofolate reductase
VRKLILNLAVSLDGFIEGPNGEFDWCFTDQDYGMKDFLGRIDAIFFGRRSYEVLLQTEKNPYPGLAKFVFSRTWSTAEGVTIIHDNLQASIQEIKNGPGKDIWLFGGAQVTGNLMNLGLVDELQLAVHPILLGRGKPLLANLENRTSLRLVDTKTYSTVLVQFFYTTTQHKEIHGSKGV